MTRLVLVFVNYFQHYFLCFFHRYIFIRFVTIISIRSRYIDGMSWKLVLVSNSTNI